MLSAFVRGSYLGKVSLAGIQRYHRRVVGEQNLPEQRQGLGEGSCRTQVWRGKLHLASGEHHQEGRQGIAREQKGEKKLSLKTSVTSAMESIFLIRTDGQIIKISIVIRSNEEHVRPYIVLPPAANPSLSTG